MSRTYVTESVPPLEFFLMETNRTARVRLFDASDYERFMEHVAEAQAAAKHCLPYYWENNGGTVSKSYKYCADTARCGVYACPSALSGDEHGYIMVVYDRVRCSTRVPCIYRGGERSYIKWFNSKKGYWFA